MRDLVIIGVGGVGRALRFFVDDANEAGSDWRLIGFLDDDAAHHGRTMHGLPVLGSLDWLSDHPGTHALLGVGDPRRRADLLQRITAVGDCELASLVHPRAYVGANVVVRPGSVLYPGSCVEPDTILGDAVLVNQNATVGHDCEVRAFATLAPLVAVGGAVLLGEGCNLGIGCSVIQGVRIGAWAIVGAGAAVISDVPDGVTAAGVPAKIIVSNR